MIVRTTLQLTRELPLIMVTVLVPPINFALVAPGIYRSGHPNHKNLPFLRTLSLKSLMYVESDGEYKKDAADFVVKEGITMFAFDLSHEAVCYSFVTSQVHQNPYTPYSTPMDMILHAVRQKLMLWDSGNLYIRRDIEDPLSAYYSLEHQTSSYIDTR
jgi:hypothetical protein